MQPIKLPFSLSRLECCAVLRRRIIGSILLESTINSKYYSDIARVFLEYFLAIRLRTHGSKKTARHASENRRLYASYLSHSEIKLFRKEYGHHAHRICSHYWSAYCSNRCSLDELEATHPVSLSTLARGASGSTTDILPRTGLCMQHDDAHFQNIL
jgi:hypothetical protein